MSCGREKIWPLFCRVGPSAARIYNLMIAAGFFKCKHRKYRWGSAATIELRFAIISQFDLEQIKNEIKDYNSAAKYEEDYK